MKPRRGEPRTIAAMLASGESSLLDLVDNVVNKGIVLDGDVLLGVADVDLVYLRLSAVLCAADRIFDPARTVRRSGDPAASAPRLPRSAPSLGAPGTGAPALGAPARGVPASAKRKRPPRVVAPRRPPSTPRSSSSSRKKRPR